MELSPYRYEKDFKAEIDNEKTGCDVAFLEKQREKGIITDFDMHIISCIRDFGLISRKSATDYINAKYPDKKPDYKRNFQKLCNNGILLRYRFVSENRKTPYVYKLSAGAKAYADRIFGRSFVKKYTAPDIDIADTGGCLRLVAFNQFYVRLVTAGYKIDGNPLYDYYLGKKGNKVLIDGIVKIEDKNKQKYDFVFICLRNTDNWQTLLKTIIDEVEKEKTKLNIVNPLYTILVESHMMAAEVERFKRSIGYVMDTYYIPDIVAVTEQPLSVVYYVSPEDGFSNFREISLNL